MCRRAACGSSERSGSLLDSLFGAEALALDDDGIDVVQDAIEDGGGQGAVVVEDLRPVLVGAVGGEEDRRTLVALADDLEQQVGAMLVDGEVAELIDDQHGGLQVTAELVLEAAGRLRGRQRVDDVDGGGEEHGVSTNAGGMAKRNRDVRLAEADGADEDDVGLTFNKGQPEQVL